MVSIEYGYDYSSNRTFAYDARFQSGWPMNHAYTNAQLIRHRTHLPPLARWGERAGPVPRSIEPGALLARHTRSPARSE